MLYRNSRYRLSTPELLEDTLILNERDPVTFVDDPSNQTHVVQQGDTWWTISAKFFGNLEVEYPALLYWAIMEFQPDSRPADPTIPPEPGTLLVIPSEQIMADIILAGRQRGT